jgi:hypothetical protein
MRGRLRRLEQAAKALYISIPQPSGSPAKFPRSAAREAFLANVRRLRGEEVPEHPLSTAAANSSDAVWRESFVAGGFEVAAPPDLSEWQVESSERAKEVLGFGFGGPAKAAGGAVG